MRLLVCNTSVMYERVESVIFRIHQYVEEEKEDWAKQKTQKNKKTKQKLVKDAQP